MAESFIYVFSEKARDILVEAGFHLVASDERNGIYTFSQTPDAKMEALGEVSYLTGNTLTL